MKYNANNKPIVCMQTNSTCYKGTKTMKVKGILWHSTGANNPNLKRYVQPSDNASNRAKMLALLGTNTNRNDWNHIYRAAGLNCWIGKLADGSVATVQTMPWNYRPWGCGSGSKGTCNDGWIQFEICEDGLTDANYFNKVYKEACEITAYLCDMYNLDPNGYTTLNGVKVPIILCHQDSYKLGLGSNHGDVLHWFKKHGKTMNDVRKDVAVLMNKSTSTSTSTPSTSTSTSTATNKNFPATPFKVQVLVSDLNYRSTGSMSGKVLGQTGKGTFTIIEVKNGWGLLKSKAGWIYLENASYCKIGSTVSNGTTATSASKFTPYKVKVTADVLNIRKGAGTNYAKNGSIKDKGTYTIVAEANGTGAKKWGLLKSYEKNRNGWISLDYCKKV